MFSFWEEVPSHGHQGNNTLCHSLQQRQNTCHCHKLQHKGCCCVLCFLRLALVSPILSHYMVTIRVPLTLQLTQSLLVEQSTLTSATTIFVNAYPLTPLLSNVFLPLSSQLMFSLNLFLR